MRTTKTNSYRYIGKTLVSTESISGYESSMSNNYISKYEFGNFEDTGNWIECESKSYPGKTYFFNLRTLCSTWIRPVGRNVKLQRFRNNSRIYNTNCTCDLDNMSRMIMSSDNEEDYQKSKHSRLSVAKVSPSFRSACEKIFALMYGNVDINDCFNNDENNNVNDLISDVFKNLRHEQDTSSECYEVSGHFLTNYSDDKIRISKLSMQSNAPMLDSVEVEMHSSQSAMKMTKRDKHLANSSNDDTSIVKKPKPENYDLNRNVVNYFSPNFSKIRSKHLSTEKLQNQGGKNVLMKPSPIKPSKPLKIVCEMYGTKTINYDAVEANLPPGVKTTNLSDSSVTSSLTEKTLKPSVPKNLSSDSRSSDSRSSSSYTCSTCSSDTSEFSSSSTSSNSKR